MSNSIIINKIRTNIINKYNLSDTLKTTELFKNVIKLNPNKRSVILRIEYLLNKEVLSNNDINSLIKLSSNL